MINLINQSKVLFFLCEIHNPQIGKTVTVPWNSWLHFGEENIKKTTWVEIAPCDFFFRYLEQSKKVLNKMSYFNSSMSLSIILRSEDHTRIRLKFQLSRIVKKTKHNMLVYTCHNINWNKSLISNWTKKKNISLFKLKQGITVQSFHL